MENRLVSWCGRRICRFFRAVAFLGVAGLLDARTLLTMTRSGLLLVGASLDVAELHEAFCWCEFI